MRRFNNFLLFGVFPIIYVVFVCYVCFFKNVSPFELFSAGRARFGGLNLVPFRTISGYLSANNLIISASNILGNIVLFIPLGIFLQLRKRRKKLWKDMLIVIITAILIEIVQYAFALGAADIDDVILNTLGGLVGIYACRILQAVFRKEQTVRYAIVILTLIFILIPIIAVKLSGLQIRLV